MVRNTSKNWLLLIPSLLLLSSCASIQTQLGHYEDITNDFSTRNYEKAVNDGAFDGTFSDFMNNCVYKYFEDRNLALGWHSIQAMPRRLS